jgi:hypothetical protein
MAEKKPPSIAPSVIRRAKEVQDQMAQTIDGHPRSRANDEAISESVERLLGTGDGKIMFDWMRQITVNKVLGANATPGEFAYQEGMRALVALIEARRVDHLSRLVAGMKKKDGK